MLISKNEYLKGFGITVLVLALVRCIFPSIARPTEETAQEMVADTVKQQTTTSVQKPDTHHIKYNHQEQSHEAVKPTASQVAAPLSHASRPMDDWKHPIYGVTSYHKSFPDSNDVQLAAAQQYGVGPVANREEAEERKSELVYVGSSPFYHLDPLKRSIPYLVPRASVLLHDIGRHFFDSLQVKRIPLHKIIVTSVLRSEEDIEKLKKVNHNTSENSCHRFGTTFDISYNRYETVADPDGPPRREVRNDTLKWVLSEVLNDLRKQERCYVKYEVKQGCFHITVR
ncbi:MAG: hypothetical protein J5682_08895 [Prevotella sp.]|nr:hypothetical protein [Prevotella sp.]